MKKRSVLLNGHATSITLEDEFWNALKDMARDKGVPVASLIADIDSGRSAPNLSSAIRVYVLEWFRKPPGGN